MAKSKPIVKMESWGLYTQLDKQSKELPKLIRFTDRIPCKLGAEFGYILHIYKARGLKLTFEIDHPPFRRADGEIDPPFTGEEYVRSNDWSFFLGDTPWEPLTDKLGAWRLRVWLDGQLVADRTFTLEQT